MNQFEKLKQGKIGLRAATMIQFGSKYLNVAVQLVITMILARLLTPEEYGVMAIISVFLGLFAVLSNFGIGAAVVQYRDLSKSDCEALFCFTVILGFGLAICFSALSLLIADFYNNSDYIAYMTLGSLTVIFQAANMVPNGLLLRDKKFLTIGIRLVLTSVVAGMLTVAMAINGFGIWALVLNTVIQAFLNFTWNFIASDLRKLNIHFAASLKIVGKFSGFQFAAQFMQYLARNLDTILIGGVFGSTALGFYDKAYKLARYPIDIIPNTLNPVLKSFFSEMECDLERLYALYFDVEKTLSVLGVFISIFCFFSADELVLLFFGDQWVESIPVFQALSVSIVFQMMNFTAGSILEGVRRTDYLGAVIGISSTVLTLLLVAGLFTGNLVITSWLVSLGYCLYSFPVLYFVIKKVFGKAIVSYVIKFIPEYVCGAALAGVYVLLSNFIPDILIVSFVIKLAIGVVVYFVALSISGQSKYLRRLVKKG